MTLVEERNDWRDAFNSGDYERPWMIVEYDQVRDNNHWRASRIIEELCEYCLHLERLIGKEDNYV